MRKIDRFYKYIGIIDNIKIKEFENINILKILYCDIWNMFGLTKIGMLKRIIAQILFNPIQVKFLDDETHISNRMAVQVKVADTRQDNQTIFENLLGFLRPNSNILVEKKYVFNPQKIVKKIILEIRFIKAIKGISFIERSYLASQLLLVNELRKRFIEITNWEKIEYLLIFQEHDTISSYICQFAHIHNIKIISPQHGMTFNRYEDLDQLIFEGFLADYKLLWNEFEKQQFISAGIDSSKLYVVGDTKLIYNKSSTNLSIHTDKIGVVLDCPLIENAIEVNRFLIHAANAMGEQYHKEVIIRLHPMDNRENYSNCIDSAQIVDKNVAMSQFTESIDFAVAHITGAIVEMISAGKLVFIYKNKQYYPIESCDLCFFEDIQELRKNYDEWIGNVELHDKEYKKIVSLYHVDNIRERHEQFFGELFDNKI